MYEISFPVVYIFHIWTCCTKVGQRSDTFCPVLNGKRIVLPFNNYKLYSYVKMNCFKDALFFKIDR